MEGWVWELGTGGVDGFVLVVPGGRVEDVVEVGCFGLREDWVEFVSAFEGGGG